MNDALFISWIEAKYQLFINTARKNLHGHLKNMAEDIAHDAIYIMLKKAETFDGNERQFDAYANRTVITKCIDYARSGHAKCDPVGFSFNEADSDDSFSVLENIIRLERRTEVRRALLKLKRRDMLLILLRVKFDCSAREIEQRLGIPEANVSQYYKRAMKQLAKKLRGLI